MEWKRGYFRLAVVFSVCWIAGVAIDVFVSYEYYFPRPDSYRASGEREELIWISIVPLLAFMPMIIPTTYRWVRDGFIAGTPVETAGTDERKDQNVG